MERVYIGPAFAPKDTPDPEVIPVTVWYHGGTHTFDAVFVAVNEGGFLVVYGAPERTQNGEVRMWPVAVFAPGGWVGWSTAGAKLPEIRGFRPDSAPSSQ